MDNPNIILYSGLIIIAIYLFLFFKLSNTLTKEEHSVLRKQRSKFIGIMSILPFFVIGYFDNYYLRLSVGAFIVISTTIETIFHHRKLRMLHFNPVYERKLLKITYVSAIGIILLVIWFIMTAKT